MPARVLFCRSNPILPDPRVEKEAATLSTAGYAVRVLGWDRTAKLPAEQVSGDYQITRLRLRAPFGKGLMNLPNLLRWQVGLLKWLATHRGEYDLVHTCDFDTILPALVCQKLWGKKIIYDIFDFYAEHLRRTPSLLKKIIRKIDLWAIGQADAVILADEARKQQIQGSRPKRIEIIYNSPEDRFEALGTTTILTTALSNTPPFRIAYTGLLQVERGLLELLEILRHHPQWCLDLAGFGGDEGRILAVAGGMPNVTWHGRIPYERALELNAQADILFATYDPAIPNHRLSSPNKLFEALMLGKPIIVARNTHMDHLVESIGCGLVIEYGNMREIESALALLHQDPELRLRMGQKGRRAYEANFSWSKMQARLLQLYQEVCA